MPSPARQQEPQEQGRLRQRLWGATVLIAIAVIALPLLLDGAGSESQFRRVERLQAAPEPEVAPSLGAAAEQTLPAVSVVRDTQEVLDEAEQPLTAWVVQAAEFSDEIAAVDLRDGLRRAGFASFVRDRDANSDPFRVLVGPMIKQSTAENSLNQVAALLQREFPAIKSDPLIMVYP